MADEQESGAQAAPEPEAQEATPSQPPEGDETSTQSNYVTQEDFDRSMRELRRENQSLRKRAKDAEEKASTMQSAAESEDEKRERERAEATRRADAAEAALAQERLRSALIGEATRQRVVDPEVVAQLIPPSSIELDESGMPNAASVSDAVADVLKSKPYLLPQEGTAQGGSGRAAAVEHEQKARDETDDEKRARIYGGAGAGALWDPARAREIGGGVVPPGSA